MGGRGGWSLMIAAWPYCSPLHTLVLGESLSAGDAGRPFSKRSTGSVTLLILIRTCPSHVAWVLSCAHRPTAHMSPIIRPNLSTAAGPPPPPPLLQGPPAPGAPNAGGVPRRRVGQQSIRMAVHYRMRGDPPPPDQSDHRGKKRNLPLGKSCRAIFCTQISGSQTPPPPL